MSVAFSPFYSAASATYFYRRCIVVCVSICLLVTFVSPAKTAEPIEIWYEEMICMGPRLSLIHI